MVRRVEGTNLSWPDLAGWVALVLEVCGHTRASEKAYRRCRLLVWSLTIDDIRTCTDLQALDAAAELFDLERRVGYLQHGPRCVMTRPQIGEYLVECRNQAERLRSGAAFRDRAKGPRFDPQRLPAAALERLIQTHPDMATVETLRSERNRRAALQAADQP